MEEGYPDVEFLNEPTGTVFYIEIKAQRITFMSVKRILPEGGLELSETLALNLNDLLRCFEIRKATGKTVFTLQHLENRPCIVPEGKIYYYYQNVEKQKQFITLFKIKDVLKSESGRGDVVNKQYKGVIVNYHFSLNELKELYILQLLKEGIAL